ncbi:MAG: cell division protein ZapA [Polyangiaceae bacterium]|nr:cell division protein ZapA [Polyangiaceae bacterium]
MSRAPVELRVGGQSYRVIASAEEAELLRLAGVVDARMRELAGPGRAVAPQSLLLVAISLAHDLERERGRREVAEEKSKALLREVVSRIDALLDELPEEPAGPPRGATTNPATPSPLR